MKKTKIIWTIAFIILIQTTTAQILSSTDLDFCYDFDLNETNTFTDFQGNYDGTIHGNPTYNTTDPASGTGYYTLDGSGDYFNSTYSGAMLDRTRDVTFCMIVRAKEELADGTGLAGYYNAGDNKQFRIEALDPNDDVRANVGVNGANNRQADTTTNIDQGAWYLYCARYNATGAGTGEIDVFINATQEGTSSGNIDNFNTSTKQWHIGERDDGTPSSQWKGDIDTTFMANRLLTNAEITTIYSSGSFSTCTELVGTGTVSNFSITAQDLYWNTTINTFSATINGTQYNTTTGQINTTIPQNSTILWNITINTTSYFDHTYLNYNVSTDLQANLTINHTTLNITAFDFWNNSINVFEITITSQNSTHTENRSTTTGELTFNTTWNETYTINIDPENYSLFNTEINHTMDEFFERVNFTNIYTTNSIDLTFRDETTKNLTYNVSFELISDVFSQNYTTNPNATKYLDLISPSNYIIRYQATGYPQKIYTFTLTNRSYNNLTLYLTNSSDNITVTVYDEINNIVQGAFLNVLKYDITTNSYILVEIAQTNIEGQTIIHIFKNIEFYKFQVELDGEYKPILPAGTLTSDPSYIYDNTLSIQIETIEDIANQYFQTAEATYSLVFNNATNNFRFDYADPTNIASQACLRVYDLTTNPNTIFNQSCTFTPAGTVLVGIQPINGTTYRADAYITWDTEQFIDNTFWTFQPTEPDKTEFLFGLIIITIIFTIIGVIAGGIIGVIIATPIPMMVFSFAGIGLPYYITVPIFILSIFIAYTLKDKG